MEVVCLLLGVLFIGAGVIVAVIKNILYVAQPNEVLIFSGRSRRIADRALGYRIIKGGRAVRWPIIERLDRMDLTNMIIEVTVRNAYSKGGIPLTVQGVANIKVPGEEPLIHNTLERFLGRSRDDIMRVARETLEGNLRGVLATLSPEQVNQDKEAFAGKLTEEAEHDLDKIGLVLDTLKIQNVTDEVGYLDSIGRTRSAQIRRNAQIAEAAAQAEAAEVKWRNFQAGELAKLEAAIAVARSQNERRINDAKTRREAMIAEQRAEVQAAIAQTQAEVLMEQARIEQTKLRLRADILQPAEADMKQQQERARADAAVLIERGRASAKVLADLAGAYREAGAGGRDALLMQKLLPVMTKIAETIGPLQVAKMTVIGPRAGVSDDAGTLAATLASASEQVRAALGVDVPELVASVVGDGERRTSPTRASKPPTPGAFGP